MSDVQIGAMTEYDADVADDMGKILMGLSSKYDGSPIEREWIEDVIESANHDILLATIDDKLVGVATVSIVMGPLIKKNVYLEDFVVDQKYQGNGIGTRLFEAVQDWGRKKGCRRLEFTSSGKGKKACAVAFYQKRGAEIRDTNAFRIEL
jgi:GNAT superfamily N-acetyltransferase